MRIKIDGYLPLELVDLLNEEGHDAASALGQELGGVLDSRLADRCQAEERALVTLDIGFADNGHSGGSSAWLTRTKHSACDGRSEGSGAPYGRARA